MYSKAGRHVPVRWKESDKSEYLENVAVRKNPIALIAPGRCARGRTTRRITGVRSNQFRPSGKDLGREINNSSRGYPQRGKTMKRAALRTRK
ncbi:MAG: hypothetical protein ABS79_05405 [Planctomycetes bacterium SCN 63-9]|nr:MAG: hypothetical protein ABS79_05405 [Planctomycetes bacterium SCN 63-9]